MGIVTIVVQMRNLANLHQSYQYLLMKAHPNPNKDEKGHMLGRLTLSHLNGRPPKQRNSYKAVKTDQYEKGRRKGDLWLILSMLHSNNPIYVSLNMIEPRCVRGAWCYFNRSPPSIISHSSGASAKPEDGSNHPPAHQPSIYSDRGGGEYLELMGHVPYIDTPASPCYNIPKPNDEKKREILKIR